MVDRKQAKVPEVPKDNNDFKRVKTNLDEAVVKLEHLNNVLSEVKLQNKLLVEERDKLKMQLNEAQQNEREKNRNLTKEN